MQRGSQERFRDSISRRKSTPPKDGFAHPAFSEQDGRKISGCVLRLTNLLGAVPVDLARISEEIRSQPRLETLVIGLTASLLLSPETSVTTLEEAVVVLGTDRLRVMVYMWSNRPEDCHAVNFGARVKADVAIDECKHPELFSGCAGPSPETLYLASFLRWLGLDSPNPATSGHRAPCFALGLQRAQFADLRNTLIRDFLALVPVLTHRF
jgi:hypothetical protein